MSTNTFEQQVDEMKKKHSELEKKVENIINDYETVECPNTKEIDELREEIKNGDIMVLEPLMKDITELKEWKKRQLDHNIQISNILSDFGSDYSQRCSKLEEVLRECFDRFPSYNGIDIPREYLKKIDDWRTSMQILLKKLSGEKEIHHETLEMKGTRESNLGMKVSDETSKPEEPIDLSRRCSKCGKELNIEPSIDPLCETCYNIKCSQEESSDYFPEDLDRYVLYRKTSYRNRNIYYLKKDKHPFTELNNMVNLGIGEIVVEKEDLQFTELRDKIETLIEYVDQYTHITPSHRAIQILNEFRKKYLEEQTK